MKTQNEILKELLLMVPSDYDTSVGSFFYDNLKPISTELENVYKELSMLVLNAFASTATGKYLEQKALEQGLLRKNGHYAKGIVTIYGDIGATIQKGSKVACGNILFSIDETNTISNTGYAELPATCDILGSIGNVKAGSINRFPVTLPGLISVTNTHDFTGGYDTETDDELRTRYLEKVSRPNASGNKNDYIKWAKSVEGVGNADVIPLWNGAGSVKVIISDSNNQPADDELLSKVSEYIEQNRPIGADVTVLSVVPCNINISVTLIYTSEDKDIINQNIKNAVSKYLSDTAFSDGYVSYAKIGGVILDVDGVGDYIDLKINDSVSNIQLEPGTVPVLNEVVIT